MCHKPTFLVLPPPVLHALLRQCTATKQNGEPCQGWACWDDPLRSCVSHCRPHRGPTLPGQHRRSEKTRYTPCMCIAYAWPHRPGGGLCRWPDPPLYRSSTPKSTHAWPRGSTRFEREFLARMRRYRGRMSANKLGKARQSTHSVPRPRIG